MRYDNLPIYKTALDFCVYIEVIVKSFLLVRASFLGHIKHSNSYNLKKKVGEINETKYINNNFFNA